MKAMDLEMGAPFRVKGSHTVKLPAHGSVLIKVTP